MTQCGGGCRKIYCAAFSPVDVLALKPQGRKPASDKPSSPHNPEESLHPPVKSSVPDWLAVRVRPAMEAGPTDRVWAIEELVAEVENDARSANFLATGTE
jgi:hypothetical protein